MTPLHGEGHAAFADDDDNDDEYDVSSTQVTRKNSNLH